MHIADMEVLLSEAFSQFYLLCLNSCGNVFTNNKKKKKKLNYIFVFFASLVGTEINCSVRWYILLILFLSYLLLALVSI